ncbi:ABC-type uncharacterized transport system permease subunit [Rhizobium mongolense]
MRASFAAILPTLVRRERASLTATLLAPPVALGVATILNLGLYVLMGRDPVAVFYAMLLEPFLSWASFSEVMLKTGPLLLIAQGLAIGFRAKVFNIGAEGQFILGAIFASAIPVWFPQATGQWIWPLMLFLGALGGASWASLTAFWRVRLNANEILVSLMLSLVAAQLLNYLLLGPWKDPNGFNFPQSVMFQYDAMVPILISGTRINVSLLLTIVLSMVAWIFMQKSFTGYKLQVGGPRAACRRLRGFQRRPRDLAFPSHWRMRRRACWRSRGCRSPRPVAALDFHRLWLCGYYRRLSRRSASNRDRGLCTVHGGALHRGGQCHGVGKLADCRGPRISG